MEARIRQKLQSSFSPLHLEVINESFKHHVPPGSETHFRVLVVADGFAGLSRLERQRRIFAALADELAPGGVHALAQRALSPAEWHALPETARGLGGFSSPECQGSGSARGSTGTRSRT